MNSAWCSRLKLKYGFPWLSLRAPADLSQSMHSLRFVLSGRTLPHRQNPDGSQKRPLPSTGVVERKSGRIPLRTHHPARTLPAGIHHGFHPKGNSRPACISRIEYRMLHFSACHWTRRPPRLLPTFSRNQSHLHPGHAAGTSPQASPHRENLTHPTTFRSRQM
jgi:hypothetical protein